MSNGATLLNSTLQTSSSNPIVASAISWKSSVDNKNYLRIKVVNFGSSAVALKISISGLKSIDSIGSKTVLTSNHARMKIHSTNQKR
ncbi:hypothetical protein ACH5RR_015408 [Cinchona calisaya]|uniref:Uncharacterized protein n=1 Tax=Cinchona calisaya TaxID=153742 RepID=A0ABD2ZTW5_9GENT